MINYISGSNPVKYENLNGETTLKVMNSHIKRCIKRYIFKSKLYIIGY